MKHILVLGAGLSSAYLIRYLLENAQAGQWQVTVADIQLQQAQSHILNHANGKAVGLESNDVLTRNELIASHDLVISLLPPTMHVEVAQACIRFGKHLITASYISEAMHKLDADAKAAGLLLLNECGLDPGIDHLSAMQLIHAIQQKGGTITSFQSHCGGLVAPEFDDNPWHYKFTWNPRNVVLAGQATAKFKQHGTVKYITPQHLFEQTQPVSVKGYGNFESYANRDSLGYIEPYGIESAGTVFRGTLRKQGFSAAWNLLVRLGLTDDGYQLDATNLTMRQWLNAYVPGTDETKLEERLCAFLAIERNSKSFALLEWLGLFTNATFSLTYGSPAQLLQSVLQQKWKLKPGELDMIVMKHELTYELEGKTFYTESELVVKGESERFTAMAKTVGLPLGIAAKLVIQQKVQLSGVHMPIQPVLYEPMLAELKQYGIAFTETTTTV